MRKKSFLILSVGILLSIAVSLGFRSEKKLNGNLVIETGTYKMELSEKGSVLKFTHVPSGTVLIQGNSSIPLYELGQSGNIAGGYGGIGVDVHAKKGTLENNLNAQVNYVSVQTEQENGYRFVSSHHNKIVTTEIVSVLSHGGIEFRMSIVNNSGNPVGAIRYPCLIAPDKLGHNEKEDVILIPALDGGIVEDPKARMAEKIRVGDWPNALSPYPGNACCQLTAYYNKKAAGMYIACHDPNGNGKVIGAAPFGTNAFDFSVWHLRPENVTPHIELNYPVVVDVFTGDWYQAAEKYRNWSLRQKWSKERLYNSTKVPEYAKNGLMHFGIWSYPENAWDQTAESNPSGSAARVKKNNEIFGMQQFVFQQHWAKYGKWVGMEWLPPQRGEEEFKLVAQRIKEQGAVPMIYLSGFEQTNKGTGFDNTEKFWREMAPYAIRLKNGKVLNAPSIETPGNFTMALPVTRMCLACQYTKDIFVNTCKYCVASGYPIIHLDQHNGGRYTHSICYSNNHGHPPGGGTWIQEELVDLFKQTWPECSAISSDFTLSMEQPGELFMPYLTMGQSRYCVGIREFPYNPPLSQPIPLLLYLHHEHFFAWVEGRLSRTTDANKYFALAKAFVAGNVPGVPVDFNLSSTAYNQYLNMFRNLIKAYLGYAKEPLFYGRMMAPLELEVAQVNLSFPPSTTADNAFHDLDTLTIPFPAVLNSVWLTPGGKTFIILVNHTNVSQTTTLNLAKTPGYIQGVEVNFWNESGSIPVLSKEPAIPIPPYSMGALEFNSSVSLSNLWLEEDKAPQAINKDKF